jgi:uncharacterized protein (DUF362 family)
VGSIESIIKKGETVLIKPNLAIEVPSASFSVVDPRVIKAVASYLRENSKGKEVWVDDNHSLCQHVGRARPAFEMNGMRAVDDRVIFFDEEEIVDVEIEGAS